ncbi:hypothetical protein [Nocardia cyriacigeorgica]|uniref:hypothetical protein n=1 Tax=Nocardia cyriacigeorgica TaxID=135487 RepID=UPI001E48D5EA|nr:hypothetical protein [Nocardia cyriacigeorgica]
MTAMWFGLAAIALVGAVVLLYFDRLQRQRTGHARQVWAKAQGYTYVSVEPALPSTWRRGALAKLGYLSAVDVVSGIRKGEKFVLFDLEDSATLVAVRRQIGSDIDVDMRLKTASPPKDHDLELLGAIGDRVVFATNPEIARHAVDQRMVAFIETLPETVQMLWSEGNWTLGMLSVGTTAKEWETAIDAVLRLSGLLHVLPPVAEPRGLDPEGGRSHGRARARAAESDEPDERPARVAPPRFRDSEPEPDDADYDEFDTGYDDSDYDDTDYDDSDYDEPEPSEPGDDAPGVTGARRASRSDDLRPGAADATAERDRASRPDGPAPEPPSSRRPSLAVVPDARPAAREERVAERIESVDRTSRPGDFRAPASDDDAPQLPGGPFHPGFRPYQGPVPK